MQSLAQKMRSPWITLLVFFVLIPFLLSQCEGEANPLQPQLDEITLAYLNLIGKAEGTAIVCRDKTLQATIFILCQRKSMDGSTNAGLWVLQKNGEGYDFLALNGKAQTALEHFSTLPNFKRHPYWSVIDVSAVLDDFAGDNKPVLDIKAIESRKLLSEKEKQIYCDYEKAADELSVEATKKGWSAGSDKRQKWIDPKIAKLEKKYFDANGLTHDEVFSKILAARSWCSMP